MYNQTEAILSQYELEIGKTSKGRGVYICETNKGAKTLVTFRGSKEKGEFLKEYLSRLQDEDFEVEQILANKENSAITEDEISGERFLLKDYIKGIEVSTTERNDLLAAMELLAFYHYKSDGLEMEIPVFLRDGKSTELDVRRRHFRELVKVKNYIRGRKKKNDFDRMFVQAYDAMIETAEQSLKILEAQDEMAGACVICHGDYNQHNILWAEDNWQIVNFENFTYGWSVMDLCNFLRKIMEKNDWDVELGKELLGAYDSVCSLKEDEWEKLYGLLLFPEKFWKVSNHYMNSRKSWMSERDIEKLEKVVDQETRRKNFIQNLFPFYS